jgi:hypothetical protein
VTVVGAAVAVAAGSLMAALLIGRATGQDLAPVLAAGAPVAGCAAVGALLCTRVPRNAIGWLFMAVALQESLGQLADVYAHRVGAAGGAASALTAAVLEVLPLMLLPMLVLLFPEGRLPSPRWRPVLWAWIVMVAVVLADIAVTPGSLATFSTGFEVQNPLGLHDAFGRVAGNAGNVSFYLLMLVGVIAAVGLVRRYRRAPAELRLQLKWFATCALLLVLAIAAGPVGLWTPWNGELWVFTWELALTGLVVATGIAVLRYRLYDIDLIIRRTLIYSLLVGALTVLYLVGVSAIGRLFESVTGQSGTLAPAVSTLAVVVAFQPFRRRIQRLVDRRFYRASYNATRLLDEFSERLRNPLDLTALETEVLGVVTVAVQPRHAALWLLPSASESRQKETIDA